jgi:hypothetical protein
MGPGFRRDDGNIYSLVGQKKTGAAWAPVLFAI